MFPQVLIALFPIAQKSLVQSYHPACLTGLGLVYSAAVAGLACVLYCSMLLLGVTPLHGGSAWAAIVGTLVWICGPGLPVLVSAGSRAASSVCTWDLGKPRIPNACGESGRERAQARPSRPAPISSGA